MKRPACIVCFTSLLTLLAAACLPRAAFVLLAAVCVLGFCAAGVYKRHAGALLCAAAVLAGCALFAVTELRLRVPAERLAGRQVNLTAVVAETTAGYAEGMVSATLAVCTADGEAASVRIYCPALPECEVGETVEATFQIEALPAGRYRWGCYADGIFVQAEYLSGFARTGTQSSLPLALRRLGLRLSAGIRRYLRNEEGAVLAAMTTGDRRFLTAAQQNVYRRAGISHILVVSGLHVSLLCGLIPLKRDTRRGRVARAAAAMAAALLLMGIVGFSPSVTRAGIAVLILNTGTLLLQPGDPLTALAIAVLLMSAGNAYAVCDLALQLSFAATLGVLLAAEWTEPLARAPWAEAGAGRLAARLAQHAAVSLAAVVCTFPVWVFWGMNVSAVALLSNLLVLWLAKPTLACGLLTALCGLTPWLRPFQRLFGLLGAACVKLLNGAAAALAALPGSQLYFATPYAGIVVLVLAAYVLILRRMGCRWRRLLPAAGILLVCAALAGALLSRNVLRVALVGNAWSPAVVLTQNGRAAVLFRGGSYNAVQVTQYLQRYGIDQADRVIDLRYTSDEPCPLEAGQTTALSALAPGRVQILRWQGVQISLLSTGEGGVVCLELGGVTAAATSGQLQTAGSVQADLLLGSSSNPARVQAGTVLCLSKGYSWLAETGANTVYYGQSGLCVEVRPQISYRITGAWQ